MIELVGVTVNSGDFLIRGIDLKVEEGQCVSLKGASGSGKTTVMEAICGLREVSEGEVYFSQKKVTQASPASRHVGLVPQDNALFPSMTVREQLAYGPRVRKWAKGEVEERVVEVAKLLAIDSLLDREVEGLSGGEAKRVAIGRAMAVRPKLLCLDESFTGLDDETRQEVLDVVKSLIEQEGVSTLLITHHQSEADYLAHAQYEIQTLNGERQLVRL